MLRIGGMETILASAAVERDGSRSVEILVLDKNGFLLGEILIDPKRGVEIQ